jgi:hypothetical protein
MSASQAISPDEITIDPEFQKLIRPLSEKEREELKDSIRSAGILSPLIVWKNAGKTILIDGHNRFSVWKELGGFDGETDVPTQELFFGNRVNAKEWIIKNQLGRRNLSPDDFRTLLGLLYIERKKPAHRPGKGVQNEPVKPERTAETIAREYGVSPSTVKRAARKVEDRVKPEQPKKTGLKVYKIFSHTTPFSLAENDQELAEIMRLKYPKACSILETGAEFFARMVEDVREFEAWKVIGFASFEEFCAKELGKTLVEVEKLLNSCKAAGGIR